MNTLTVLAALAAFVVAVNAKAAGVNEEHPIDWYDCSGKKDGNYEHPSSCIQFISCSGGIASLRECATCHVDAHSCPEGQTVYDPAKDACVWAWETSCYAKPPPTSTERVTQTTDDGSDVDPTTPDDSGNDDDCDEKCLNKGYCRDYSRCVEGKWVTGPCPGDLLFDPFNPDNSDHAHGGICVKFGDLSGWSKGNYTNDPNCLECYYKEDGPCSSSYKYQKDGLTSPHEQDLECRGGLVFSKWYETCVECKDYVDANTGAPYNCGSC